MKVFVVTGTFLGWDCVVGVFQSVSKESLQRAYPEDDGYVVSECTVQHTVEEDEMEF